MGPYVIHVWRWTLGLALIVAIAMLAASTASAKVLKNGTIEGVVLNQAGKPVAGATVMPFAWSSAGADWWTWEAVDVTATTSRSGSYKLALPAGRYRVLFVPKAAQLRSYAIEAYPNMPAPDFGDDVIVKWGKATRRISAVLDPPAHIEGVVTNAANGEPVGGIELNVVFQGNARIQTLPTWEERLTAVSDDVDGTYEVWGLKPYAGFTLNVTDPTDTYWGPWFQNIGDFEFTTGSPAGVRTDNILVERTDLVKITGTVTDASTELPVTTADHGVVVNLYEIYADGGWSNEPLLPEPIEILAGGAFEVTAADLGSRMAPGYQWSMAGVFVAFHDTQNAYYDEWYNDSPYGDSDDWVSPGLGKTMDLGTVQLTPRSIP